MEIDEGIREGPLSTGHLSEAEDGELIDDDDDEEISQQHSFRGPSLQFRGNPPQDSNQLLARAKRFGINPYNTSTSEPLDPKVEKLYRQMAVDRSTRLEALHLFGTENMKTQDVFQYFENYRPASVEWITDKTCNVVWLEEKSCSEALLASSIRIIGQTLSDQGDVEEGEDYIEFKDLRLALPPGIWRKGHTRQYAPNLFIRFANRSDRKEFGRREFEDKKLMFLDQGDEVIKKGKTDADNPWADIAKQWGKYERAVVSRQPPPKPVIRDARELIRKKVADEFPLDDEKGQDSDDEDDSRLPKGKILGLMRADIEERKVQSSKSRKRQKRSMLAENDLRPLLGKRRRTNLSHRLGSRAGSEEEVPDLRSTINERLGLSSKLRPTHDEGELSDEDDPRPILGDLREKLQNKTNTKEAHQRKPFVPRSPLRIEIANDMYRSRSESSDESDDSSSSSSSSTSS